MQNFNGKLGLAFFLLSIICVCASPEVHKKLEKCSVWIECASETKVKGEWTKLVLLLVSKQVSAHFCRKTIHKQGGQLANSNMQVLMYPVKWNKF